MGRSEHELNGGYPAYPTMQGNGLTKRELFAAMAMQGYCAREGSVECDAEAIAHDACMVADALLAALATTGNLKEPQSP